MHLILPCTPIPKEEVKARLRGRKLFNVQQKELTDKRKKRMRKLKKSIFDNEKKRNLMIL